MKVHKGFLFVLACFFTLFLSAVKGYSQASCPDPVMIAEDGFVFNTIQGAYDDASLRWTDFTLLLAAETITEDLIIDGGSVLLDGGYDCSFSTKNLSTGILGSITISAGAVTFDNIGVLSPPACAFDSDNDGFTSIGSCTGSADDCNDNNANVFPGAPEICDSLDNNCDGQIDEGLSADDIDGDGYSAIGSCGGSADDCNDNDGSINPGAIETLGDGIDQDCDGQDLLFSYENDCFGCHGGPDPIDTINNQLHQRVEATDDTCAACHAAKVNAVLPGHYGQTVRTADNGIPAGAIISCTSCHDYHDPVVYDIGGANIVWPKVSATWNGSTYVNLTCDTCHEDRAARHGAAHTVEVGPNDLSYDPPGQLCSVCHIVANWSEIEGDEHFVDTNGDGSCATCHNSPRTEVQITISAGTPPIHCLDCHSDKYLTVHGAADHSSLVRVGTTSCSNCHTDPPPLVDPADPKVHNACTSCHEADFSLRSLAIGKSFAVGGDCTTCHGADKFEQHTHVHTVEVGSNDLSYDPPGTLCTSCHVVADWSQIEGTEHFVDTNGAGSCATCHYSPRQEVIDAISAGANPTNCLDCHSDKELTPHGDHDHSTTVTGSADCVTCHEHDDPQIIAGIHGNACLTCHRSSTPEVIAAIASGQAECIDCHTAHDGALIHNIGAPQSCAACHTDKISGTDFNYIINNHGPLSIYGYTELDRCQRCHNSVVPEVIAAINDGNPVDCESCHVSQHVAITNPSEIHDHILTSTGSTCGICHIENYWSHTDMNATASCAACHESANQDEFNALHQNDCLVCHLSQRSEVITAIYDGIAGTPVDCVTCHGADVTAVHPSCTTCHGEPPDGTSPPNTEGAHADHSAMGYGSVDPSCGACHDGAVHYNGTADIGILSNFDAQSGQAGSDGSTCSSTRCHGGQTTPDWLTGSIDVDTDCTECHKRRTGSTPDQYNDYYSGQHSKHVVSEGIACIECHNTATLQSGHFMNLESSGFELDPAATIGGGTTSIPSGYSGTCTLTCHGESHNNDSWSGHH